MHAGPFIRLARRTLRPNEEERNGPRSLLGQKPGSAGVSPYAAAARAADVSGLPPTFISVGGFDLFLEENMTYADR
jgi:triacylglycerol lipase